MLNSEQIQLFFWMCQSWKNSIPMKEQKLSFSVKLKVPFTPESVGLDQTSEARSLSPTGENWFRPKRVAAAFLFCLHYTKLKSKAFWCTGWVPKDWMKVVFVPKVSNTHWGKNHQLFQKVTFWKSHFSRNSHFKSLIFHKIHISKISFFTKFTLSNSFFTKFLVISG